MNITYLPPGEIRGWHGLAGNASTNRGGRAPVVGRCAPSLILSASWRFIGGGMACLKTHHTVASAGRSLAVYHHYTLQARRGTLGGSRGSLGASRERSSRTGPCRPPVGRAGPAQSPQERCCRMQRPKPTKSQPSLERPSDRSRPRGHRAYPLASCFCVVSHGANPASPLRLQDRRCGPRYLAWSKATLARRGRQRAGKKA